MNNLTYEQIFIYNNNAMNKKITLKTIDKMETILNLTSDSSRIKILLSLLDMNVCQDKDCKRDCLKCQNRIEKSVGEIVTEVGLEQSLVSHQLKILKDGRLISSRREGKRILYYLADHHVKLLLDVVLEHVMEDEKND